MRTSRVCAVLIPALLLTAPGVALADDGSPVLRQPSPGDWSPDRFRYGSGDARGLQVITPHGDKYGYAPIRHPYVADPAGRATGVLLSFEKNRVDQCSASVIASRSRSVVLTAAHCLYDPPGRHRGWARQLMFLPAFNSRGRHEQPYGVWTGARSWVPRQWIKATRNRVAARYDVGVLAVTDRASGKRLQDAMGRGLTVRRNDKAAFGKVSVYGYPGERPYNGTTLQRCLADAHNKGRAPGVLATRNCSVIGGNSGGPVLDRTGRVIAVVSHSNPTASGFGRLASASFGKLIGPADKYASGADLAISGTAAHHGRVVRYTLRVYDLGALHAQHVVLTGSWAKKVTSLKGCRHHGNGVRCDLGRMSIGQRRTIHLTARLPRAIAFTARVGAPTRDPYGRNNKIRLR